MQKSVSEDLILSVKSLRQDVESLRTEFGLLSEVVSTMQKCIAQRTAGDYVADSLAIGKSDFSEAIPTEFNTKTMGDSLEEIRDSDCEGSKASERISDFSRAMATHFNTNIVISQDNKTAEKVSEFSEKGETRDVYEEIQKGETRDVSEEIRESGTGDNIEKMTAEKISDFSEEIQSKATEMISHISEEMATHDTEIQKTEPEGNNPDGKEQNPLLKEIESEILLALDFSRVSSQGVNFPEDFPLKLENDFPGVASITLKGRYKLDNIVVTVRTPSVYTPITAQNYQYYKSSNFIMHLTVEIFPAISDGREIAFDCSAFSTGFLIENIYGRYSDKLVFSELNDNLQTQFKKYLEMRGITPSTTNNILGYMLDKVNRDKLRSLYKLKDLVEA